MVDEQIGYQLKRTQHALRLATDAALRDVELTTPQYAALCAIEAAPGQSSAGLARWAFVTPQTMNQIVHGLVKSALVERQEHPEHGRIIQLYLSEQGQQVLQAAHQRVAAVEARMLNGLSSSDQQQLLQWLQQCGAALEADASP